MPKFEYKVVPAPVRGEKAKGVKGTQARFAHALSSLMNELGRDGWEYLRADTLPCEERQGLTGKTTIFQNMLVFRRVIETKLPAAAPQEPAPEPHTPEEIVASASASLSSAPEEGQAPAIAPLAEAGPAPALGPAQKDGAPSDDTRRGVAAE